MYVSIDMDRQVFLHKHHDQETVSRLSWLECGQHTSVRMDNATADNFLRGVAHGDLCHLYKNTTGDDFLEHAGWGSRAEQFRERLREAVRNMPFTTALIEEVDAQVEAVDDRLHAGERFKYALGSRVPAQAQDLFPLQAAPLAPSQLTAADARAAENVRQHKAHLEAERNGDFLSASARAAGGLPPLPGTAPMAPTTSETPEEPTLKLTNKARAGSVQPIVFAAAKEAWENRKPETTWKEVKDQLFVKLTGDGHHPTTVRIKLSKWAKENGL